LRVAVGAKNLLLASTQIRALVSLLILAVKLETNVDSMVELLLVVCSLVLVSLPLVLEDTSSTNGKWEKDQLILNYIKQQI